MLTRQVAVDAHQSRLRQRDPQAHPLTRRVVVEQTPIRARALLQAPAFTTDELDPLLQPAQDQVALERLALIAH